MFERYTEKARRVIFFARYEASEFGSPYIESEHLLLGFLRESKALSARIFSGCLFSADDIRKEVESHTTAGKKIATSVDLPLSNECKRILKYASEEADRLGHKHIGTEHLLVGMLLEKDCYAARLLNERSISLEKVRSNVSEEPIKELSQPKSPGIPAGSKWKSLIYNRATETIIVEMACIPEIAHAETGSVPISRLFMRRRDAERYESIGEPSNEVSFESPVTCEKKATIFFNSMKWEGQGGNHDGVYSFDLITKELTVCIARDRLSLPEPYQESWISKLVSVDDDAKTLLVQMGLKRPVPTGAQVDYYLAKVTLVDKKLELLTHLKDIWF